MEHLSLEIFDLTGNGSKFATLPDDTSISITDSSEIFASGDVWSHSFTLNIPANRHIFGTADEIHGSRLHELLNKRKARLWVDGLPLYLGYLMLEDEVEVDNDGNVDVGFESGRKTFGEMIEGAKANQVPIPDDILIGMAVDRERTLLRYNAEIRLRQIVGEGGNLKTKWDNKYVQLKGTDIKSQMFPKYVRPDGRWIKYVSDHAVAIYELNASDTINTDSPYDDGHPYCNVTICYQDREYTSNGSDVEEKAVRGYHISSPRRINPSPNFFVLYWFKLLMQHLGIIVEENQMLDIEDMRRLFFVNTKCAYQTKGDTKYTGNYMPFGQSSPFVPQTSTEDPSWSIKAEQVTGNYPDCEVELLNVGSGVENITWQLAYATSANFPDVDIQEVIDGLETGFGVRLVFNNTYERVRVVLLRNIFRSQEVCELNVVVTGAQKTENCIRGFRLTYGGGDDNTAYNYKGFTRPKKNEGNWELGPETHDYTQFKFYDDYVPISQNSKRMTPTCYVARNTGNSYVVKIDEDFKNASDEAYPSLFECAQFMDAEDGDCTGGDETIKEVRINFTPAIMSLVSGAPSYSDNTLYGDSDLATGSKMSYAFFIDKEMAVPYKNADAASQYQETENAYKRAIDMTPYEILENVKDSIISSKDGCTNTKQYPQYMSGLLEVATAVPFNATDDLGRDTITIFEGNSTHEASYKVSGWIRDGYRLYLDDNLKVNDTMLSPLEEKDWGLSLGILRGSAGTSHAGRTIYNEDLEEDEGNDYWITEPGDNTSANPDICDDMGNLWVQSTMHPYTGFEYGDKLLDDARCVNRCDLKTRRGPIPAANNIHRITMTYVTSQGTRLLTLSIAGYYAMLGTITDTVGNAHTVWLCCVNNSNVLMTYDFMQAYIDYLQLGSNNTVPTDIDAILARDAAGYTHSGIYASDMIIGIDPIKTTDVLKNAAFNYLRGDKVVNYGDISEIASEGRVSLKLRAEKPNPYFDPQLGNVIKSKDAVAKAMQLFYTTANTDLLNRPTVSNAVMRTSGWNVEKGGYTNIYGIGMGIKYSDGTVHEILWTPIQENGTVLAPMQLQDYVSTFDGVKSTDLMAHDTQHLILDIDTTEERAEILHQLQAVYYAAPDEEISPVDISGINRQYLEITNPNLRGRGLADQFYKEYSKFIREARTWRGTVKMELAQLLTIDKTVRVRIGDITGFILKLEYSVSKESGLGDVTMEILYI